MLNYPINILGIFAVFAFSQICAAERDKFENLDAMCTFMEKHLAKRRATTNIATVTVGPMIEEVIKQMDVEQDNVTLTENFHAAKTIDHDNARSGGLKKAVQRVVNSEKLNDMALVGAKSNVGRCVRRLARKSRENLLRLQIDEASGDFQNLLLNGREFISKIIFVSSYEIKEKFFVQLVEAALSPYATKDTIVEDIGIGSTKQGYWSRKVLDALFKEDYVGKIGYYGSGKNKDKPHWEANFTFPNKATAILQFCQWPEELGKNGQKFRMTVTKPEDEETPNIVEKIQTFLMQKPKEEKEICF